MASPTAQYLVRELATRMGEFYLSTPTAGSQFSLTDTGLIQYIPADVPYNAATGSGPMWWCYGASNADSGNRGVERRVKSFIANTGVCSFFSPWPMNITTGDIEFHFRTPRSRKLEAINAAIRTIGFQWYRPVVDETITTINNQWQYTLPSSVLWRKVSKIFIQIATQSNLVGYPYEDLQDYDYDVYQTTAADGSQKWILQFSQMPVPGRLLRIFGEAEYADLVLDADVVPLPAKIQGRAIEFIYEFAQARLYEWECNKQPQGEDDRYFKHMQERLDRSKKELLQYAPGPRPWRVIIPGQGTATSPGGDDPRYFGAYRMLH